MTWILTNSGKHFDYADPQPDQIDILDIAQGLANECRYAGQCRVFYSVAQHSTLASQIVSHEHALEALLHDASEAYCKDIPRPLKHMLPDYKEIEKRVEAAVFSRFGISNLPPSVKAADLVMLATEQRDLMAPHDDEWALIAEVRPLADRIVPLTPFQAKVEFIDRYYELLVEQAKTVPAIVFYPSGSLGEAVESEGGEA